MLHDYRRILCLHNTIFYENKLVSALFFPNNYTCFNTVHDFSSTGEQKKEWWLESIQGGALEVAKCWILKGGNSYNITTESMMY